MGRVINPNAPGSLRNQHKRTIAEMLRRLSQQQSIDQEAKDITATVVYSLRAIEDSVMKTVYAWEKRDYWTKADRFLREWEWAGQIATDMEDLIRQDQWSDLPLIMASLFPHFVDVNIKKMTRKPSVWLGAHGRLTAEMKENRQ